MRVDGMRRTCVRNPALSLTGVIMEKIKLPFRKRGYFPPPMKLIVRRDDKKTETDSGLAIPDRAQQKETKCTVVAVGGGVPYAPGDRLVYGGYYQLYLADGDDNGLVVLRFPEEVMYKFVDESGMRDETDEEFEARVAEKEADELRSARRQGHLSVVEDGFKPAPIAASAFVQKNDKVDAEAKERLFTSLQSVTVYDEPDGGKRGA